MKKRLAALALAVGIVGTTSASAFACEQTPPPPTPDPGQHVFIFCGANAIHRNRVDVVFTGGPVGAWRVGGIGSPTNVDAFPGLDVRLGKLAPGSLVEGYLNGTEHVTRVCSPVGNVTRIGTAAHGTA